MKKLVVAASFVSVSLAFAHEAQYQSQISSQEIKKAIAISTSAPFVSSLVSSLPEDSKLAKEQLEEVRSDAIDFIADSEYASEALLKSIEVIRTRFHELKNYSDIEIAGLIISALN